MLFIIIKNAIRNFTKNFQFSIINVLGHVLALTVLLFIAHHVLYEYSFDGFFKNSGQVYRVARELTVGNEVHYHGAKSPRGIYYSKDQVPGVQSCGYSYYESCQIRYRDVGFNEQNVLWVSEDFETVFSFDLAKGEATFDRPLVGIISSSKAKAIFGHEDPIGKIIKVNEGMPVEVTGVYEDLPSNTHLQADYFISTKTWVKYGWIGEVGSWEENFWWVYLKLAPNAIPGQIEKKLEEMAMEHIPERNRKGQDIHFQLQSLQDIHFTTDLLGDFGPKVQKTSLMNLVLLGLFVLVVAWINYLNLSTALAMKRETTIGVQRAVGAGKRHLTIQAFADSFLVNTFAGFLALILYFIFFKPFCQLFDVPLHTAFIEKGRLFLYFGLAWATGIFLSAAYNLMAVLKINPFARHKKIKENRLRKILVIAQLGITMAFISSTLMIYRQLDYAGNYNLGAELDQVIIFSAPTSFNGEEGWQGIDYPKIDQFRAFRQTLLKKTAFVSATASNSMPGTEPPWANAWYTRSNTRLDENKRYYQLGIDNGYLQTFNLELLAGNALPSDKNAYREKVLINETALKQLRFSSPEESIGQQIQRGDNTFEIAGVIKDYHHEGLKKAIYPMIFEYDHPSEFGYYFARVNSTDMSKAITELKDTWEQFYPTDPFFYFFQDEFYSRQYKSEKRFAKFNLLFAALSIFISCMGLYGMVVFYIARRIKEIGIRKVNGARVGEILGLLNKDFLVWVMVAFALATPVSWYFLGKWLENFAYRATMSWWIFTLAGTLALFITLFTVSWQSWQAARKNPVEALRYE